MIDSKFYELTGPFSLEELLIGLEVVQPPVEQFLEERITGPADLSSAKAGQISFLANRKFKGNLDGSKATACFVSETLAKDVSAQNIIPIISDHPRAHFARIISKMVRKRTFGGEASFRKSPSARVHSSAVIGEGALIGENVTIGPYCQIGPGVTIAEGTVLEGQNVIECAIIGKDCLIKAGAHLGGEGFGMDGDERGVVNLPHIGRTILGDRVRIGAHSCVDRGFLGDTILGNDVKIDNLVQIAHNCRIGDRTMIAAHTGISGSCNIGKDVLMGGAVGLADHLTVGDGAQLAASSGVMNDIPAKEIWAGTPALPIREQMRIISATRKLVGKKKS